MTAAVILFTSAYALAQLPKDPEERAKVVAQIMQANARQLTLFDREGKQLNSVGQKDLLAQPVFSPDAKRLAIIKNDLENENQDLWVVDIGTGKATKITVSGARERVTAPSWSPDGSRIAYVGLRQGAFGLYQKPSNGEGKEELLYTSTTPLTLTDWSMDGKYLTFFVSDLGGGSLFALSVASAGERKPIEIFHSPKAVGGPRLSPDNRFVAYTSEETGKNELYVRPFNPNGGPGAGTQWKISEQGALGMAFWRRDGKELTFLSTDHGIMSVSLTTSPDFEFGKPRLLFRVPETTPIGPGTASVNRDGDRFVLAIPPPQLRQLTIVDRQGKVLSTIGEPARFGRLLFSPDGKRLLAAKIDPQTGSNNMWVYDIATGKATAITKDTQSDVANSNPVWSPDGKYIGYVTFKDKFSHIYRKAADGTGEAELLFRYTPGAFMGLSDWSPDGKFLTFTTGVMLMVPLRPNEKPLDRKAIEWLREDYDAFDGHFSPDGRFFAYFSNEVDVLKSQIYVRPFDSSKPETPAGPAVQVSNVKGGADGNIFWRKDGKEMYFLNIDRELLAMDISTTPKIQAGTPHPLFKLDPLVGSGAVSPDGDKFVLAMPVK